MASRSRTSSSPRPPSSITFEEIKACFWLPFQEAAVRLGVCQTSLKKICRSYGIARWPQRKLLGINKRINSLKNQLQYMKKPSEDGNKALQLQPDLKVIFDDNNKTRDSISIRALVDDPEHERAGRSESPPSAWWLGEQQSTNEPRLPTNSHGGPEPLQLPQYPTHWLPLESSPMAPSSCPAYIQPTSPWSLSPASPSYVPRPVTPSDRLGRGAMFFPAPQQGGAFTQAMQQRPAGGQLQTPLQGYPLLQPMGMPGVGQAQPMASVPQAMPAMVASNMGPLAVLPSLHLSLPQLQPSVPTTQDGIRLPRSPAHGSNTGASFQANPISPAHGSNTGASFPQANPMSPAHGSNTGASFPQANPMSFPHLTTTTARQPSSDTTKTS